METNDINAHTDAATVRTTLRAWVSLRYRLKAERALDQLTNRITKLELALIESTKQEAELTTALNFHKRAASVWKARYYELEGEK